MQAWDRLDNEGQKAFVAFTVYRDLGTSRTVDNAYKLANPGHQTKRGRASGRWYMWCSAHKWVDRARAYDESLENLAYEQQKKAMTAAAQRIERMQKVHLDNEVALASLLGERLKEILSRPIYKKQNVKQPDGSTSEQWVQSEEWSYAHVAQLAKIYSDIGRRGLGIKTDEETDSDPNQFKDFMFRTKGQLAARLPGGVMPPMPVNAASKPQLKLPQDVLDVAGAENGNGHAKRKPERPE